MSRKDFVLIAEAIRFARKDAGGDYKAVDIVAQRLGWALTDSNPQFDRERFLKACGVEE